MILIMTQGQPKVIFFACYVICYLTLQGVHSMLHIVFSCFLAWNNTLSGKVFAFMLCLTFRLQAAAILLVKLPWFLSHIQLLLLPPKECLQHLVRGTWNPYNFVAIFPKIVACVTAEIMRIYQFSIRIQFSVCLDPYF